ncbi:fibrinogen-binding adhesin SdrG C-terminal domain-containing protein, partial [Staphylococcus hominis]|uniref:fibrinogen-binding adhesin SdrG C-terminal domain-containing protein n=1 Tax=Staphylococcus hominis TaxID=1290 RepID=UPI001613604A
EEVATKEDNTEEVATKEDNTEEVATKEDNTEEVATKEILTDYIKSTNNTTLKEVLNETEGLNIDYANLSEDELLNLLVQYLANKSEQNKTEAIPRSVSRFSEPILSTTLDNAISEQGSNVNGQITASNFKITENSFDPNHSGSTELSSDFRVNGKVKEGDYFTVTIPENVSVNGDINYEKHNNTMKIKSLTNSKGHTIATGSYDVNKKVVTYTFTDYVNNRSNVKGNFQLPIFTDRKNTPNSGSYETEFGIADQKFNKTLNINYSSPVQGVNDTYGPNISSFITDIDKLSGNNGFKQTIYVNPMENTLYDSNVKIQGYHTDPNNSSTKIDNNTTFKIYMVKDSTKLNDSYYVDPQDSNLEDITERFNNFITYNNDNSVNLQFGDIDTSYVITVEGQYDEESDKNVRTRVFETNNNYYGVRRSYYWDNENIIKRTGGTASVDHTIGDKVWEDTNKDGVQDTNDPGIPGVTVTLT